MKLDFNAAAVSVKNIYFGEREDRCSAEVEFRFVFENGTPPYTWVPKFTMESGDLSIEPGVPGGLAAGDRDIVMRRALKAICEKAARVFALAIPVPR